MYPVVSKTPLMEWVHTKMSETESLEVLNLLKELYDDFNLEDVDPRGITPDDILAMYKEMSNLSLSTNSVTEDCGRI
jgi:hypothetical protein